MVFEELKIILFPGFFNPLRLPLFIEMTADPHYDSNYYNCSRSKYNDQLWIYSLKLIAFL